MNRYLAKFIATKRKAWGFLLYVLAWEIVFVLRCGFSMAAEPPFEHYKLKAAYLYNFSKFVYWPPATLREAAGTIGICVLGDDDLANELEGIIKVNAAGDRKMAVRRVKHQDAENTCQILFIGRSVDDRYRAIITSLKSGPVLTVGDDENFLRAGGMIKFQLEDRKVRFEVNLDAVEKSSIRVSSKILKLAKAVYQEGSEHNALLP